LLLILDLLLLFRSDKYNGQPGRKTHVLLGYERGEKYRKYKCDAEPSLSAKRKCDCPFRLRGKHISQGEGWVLNVKCGYHNHDVSCTLGCHPYAGRLKSVEHSLLVDMTKSQVILANILLTLKEKDECNVKTLKKSSNTCKYRYKCSIRGSRTELQQLMLMLERDHYIHFSRCLDDFDVVSDLF